MSPEERDPQFLIAGGYLEKCEDFEHDGKKVLASRLGYRINARFVRAFFGRVFNHPHAVFTDEMLRPELQDRAIFVDGMDNIVTTQKRVAKMYFDDGSIAQACPPLKALLHIMLNDEWEGKHLDAPRSPELVHARIPPGERLVCGAARGEADRLTGKLWQRHVDYLDKFSEARQPCRRGRAPRHRRETGARAENPGRS